MDFLWALTFCRERIANERYSRWQNPLAYRWGKRLPQTKRGLAAYAASPFFFEKGFVLTKLLLMTILPKLLLSFVSCHFMALTFFFSAGHELTKS